MSARQRKRVLCGFVGCPNRHWHASPYARQAGRWIYRINFR